MKTVISVLHASKTRLAISAGLMLVPALLFSASAVAATVQFSSSNWIYNNSSSNLQPNWLVTFDDNTSGLITVKLSIAAPTNAVGDMLGFGFDTTITGLTQSSLTFISSNTGEGITGFCTNSLSCNDTSNPNGSLNFNGATDKSFDYIVRMGTQGSPGGKMIQSFSFSFAKPQNLNLTADTFTPSHYTQLCKSLIFIEQAPA